jgi:hypothetical protein
MIGYIYKITNPNGLIYIGRTKNLKNRLGKYKCYCCVGQPALYNSLVKYGYDNHIVEIIHECELENLPDMEMYYINLFDSFKNGLNCTFGGYDGFLPGSDNVTNRDDVRKKLSDSKKEWYKNNKHYMLGRNHTKESIELIREARFRQDPIIRVYVLDIETGVYYYGIKELSNILNINYKTFFNRIRNTNRYENKYLLC